MSDAGAALELALRFVDAVGRGNAAAAIDLCAPEATFEMVPAQVSGTAAAEGRSFLDGLLDALPDRVLTIRAARGNDTVAVVELKLEGTQAAELMGVFNQEKHVDIDQAWLFFAAAGRISGVRAYWCQNQLYRRLAVKRLDKVSIVA